jgi:hypothetical protein
MKNRVNAIEKLRRIKSLRRKELAKLPFETKIEVLVKLQKMAQGIKRKGGEGIKTVWQIEMKES